MVKQSVKIQRWLYPISFLYGIGVNLRNKFFDWGILQSKNFNIPLINIGNLAVGGTGKTPHTEYLIKLLSKNYSIAVLSRGYKRKTKGFYLADSKSTASEIGDEPFQIKSKFPQITVAVDEKRVRGIEKLTASDNPFIDAILLDDAFQHRYVATEMNILLTDYHSLFTNDALLPAGRLREPIKGKDRAQIVIVTKCPDDIKPIDFNVTAKQLKLYPFQQLYFSRIKYGELTPVFKNIEVRKRSLKKLNGHEQVLLVTGIVSPDDMITEIRKHNRNIRHLAFSDHHNFSNKDIKQIANTFNDLKSTKEERIIITTEKDAARLLTHPALNEELKMHLYALPIEIEILQNQQDTFNKNIIDYVRKNKRNSGISEK